MKKAVIVALVFVLIVCALIVYALQVGNNARNGRFRVFLERAVTNGCKPDEVSYSLRSVEKLDCRDAKCSNADLIELLELGQVGTISRVWLRDSKDIPEFAGKFPEVKFEVVAD
jgi:hypothetical protein